MEYVRTYIQKMRVGSHVMDTIDDFNVYTKDVPFVLYGEVKDLYANDWKDHSGLDEYIPDKLPLKEYEIEVEFTCKGCINSNKEKAKIFIDYLLGKDGSGARLKMYNTHTQIGRQNIRVLSINDDATLIKDGDTELLIFKVRFKVNDPDTDIVLKK